MARPFDQLKPALTRLGPPPGQAKREVLFIHGAWGGAWVWQGLAEAVAEAGYGVNLIEQPGHGGNRWDLPWATRIDDYADLSRRAAAGLGRPVLVGHSLGGWQVQKIWEALDLPGVLLAPLPWRGLPIWPLIRMGGQYLPKMLMTIFFNRPLAVSSPAMARRLFFRASDQATVEEHQERLVPEPATVCRQMALWLHFRRAPFPARKTRPRLLIAAGKDYFFPARSQKKLAKRLGAERAVVADAPHDLWLEDPQGRVLKLLLDFLESL